MGVFHETQDRIDRVLVNDRMPSTKFRWKRELRGRQKESVSESSSVLLMGGRKRNGSENSLRFSFNFYGGVVGCKRRWNFCSPSETVSMFGMPECASHASVRPKHITVRTNLTCIRISNMIMAGPH